MSGYEVEHNIPANQAQPTQPQRRPDLSTFFSTLELVDTSGEHVQHNNTHALPLPGDVAAAFRTLANAFEMMRGRAAEQHEDGPGHTDLLEQLVETLMASADDPPREVNGVPDSFLDELDRVPKGRLKKDESCPICGNPFLDDQFPLVVTLPCHKDHRFDLDCIRPWLKLNPTCPLDRKDLIKKKAPPPPPAEEQEEEYDDMYA